MAQLVFKTGQRSQLFAVRQLIPHPDDEDCYLAGNLVAVYRSTSAMNVSRQARREGRVVPPYTVVHVTGYMLALSHQGQQGFRIWVIESEDEVYEQYLVSLVDMVRGSWTVRKTR